MAGHGNENGVMADSPFQNKVIIRPYFFSLSRPSCSSSLRLQAIETILKHYCDIFVDETAEASASTLNHSVSPSGRPAVIVPYSFAIPCNHHCRPKVIRCIGSSLGVWYRFPVALLMNSLVWFAILIDACVPVRTIRICMYRICIPYNRRQMGGMAWWPAGQDMHPI